jgi:hypothetical protein
MTICATALYQIVKLIAYSYAAANWHEVAAVGRGGAPG